MERANLRNGNTNLNNQNYNTTGSSHMKENMLRKKSLGNPVVGERKKSDLL